MVRWEGPPTSLSRRKETTEKRQENKQFGYKEVTKSYPKFTKLYRQEERKREKRGQETTYNRGKRSRVDHSEIKNLFRQGNEGKEFKIRETSYGEREGLGENRHLWKLKHIRGEVQKETETFLQAIICFKLL